MEEKFIRKCCTLCCNANGEPDFCSIKVLCTLDEFENGLHYDTMLNYAKQNDYDMANIAFDDLDPVFYNYHFDTNDWDCIKTIDIDGNYVND